VEYKYKKLSTASYTGGPTELPAKFNVSSPRPGDGMLDMGNQNYGSEDINLDEL
jgi:hypothetical protein